MENAGTLPALYKLSDTKTNLGSNLSVANQAAKAEQAQEIIDGAVNASSLGELAVTYSLLDSLANIYQASAAVVAGATSYSLSTTSVNLAPATTIAATTQTLAALQDVIDGAATGKGPLNATYSLADTLANLSNPANADIVAGTTAWTLTDPAGALGTLTEAQAAVVAGATNAGSYTYSTAYTLTTNPDTVTLADNVQVFSAPKAYTPGGNDLVNTLQNEDNLTANTQGGTLATSLTADIGNPNDSGSNTIAPIITNVDTINVSFTNTAGFGDGIVADVAALLNVGLDVAGELGGMTLDFQDIAGTETANITRISANIRNAFTNLDSDVSTLGISNTSEQAKVTVTYLNNELAASNNAVTLNLNNASLSSSQDEFDFAGAALKIEATQARGSDQQHQIEIYNINTVEKASSIATFETGVSSFDDEIVGERPQTINIDAEARLSIGTMRWESNRVETNSANQMQNDLRHEVGRNGEGFVDHNQINQVTVSGSADVTLANVGNFESVVDTDQQVDFVLNGTGLTGNLTADITNAASSTDTGTSIAGGSGTNKFYAASTDVRTSVSAGAGSKDSLTVQSNAGQTVNLRAGTGIETLNLVAGFASAAPTWNADLSFGGFDLVTINNQAATAPMSVIVTDADVGNTAFSIRSQGLDGSDQPVVTGTQGAVSLNIAQAATATGDTLSLHLGEVESDQSNTNAFSWKNFTNNVTLLDSSDAAVAIDNLDFQINSAGLVDTTPAPVNLTLNVNDFVDTMTVTTGNSSTNVFNAGDLTYADAANAIGAETYDGSAYNGNQNLIFGGTQGRQAALVGATSFPGQTVLTGTGTDFIDLSYITTNTSNTVAGFLASTFLLNSTVNSAAGNDTVVLSADLSDPRTVLLPDADFDEWFENWTGVESLIINNRNGVDDVYVAYDYFAQQAGLQNISFTGTDNNNTTNSATGSLANATIYLGDDYTGNPTADSVFVINSNVSSTQTIDSRSLVDITANINNYLADVVIVSTGATLIGANDNFFRLNYNNIAGALTVTEGADLIVQNGSLDYVDFNGNTTGANAVTVTTNDALTAAGETTVYDFTNVINSTTNTTGEVVFSAAGELDAAGGLTIFGSIDGGTLASGNVSNTITGSPGSFANGLGNDTITSGGFEDVINGLGGNDSITYSNINTTLLVANGVTINGGSGNDVISVTANDNNAVIDVVGGIDDDTITVSTAGASTVAGNLGEDNITINVQANSTNLVVAGENADLVTLTGSPLGQVTIQQGLDDSNRAVTTDFGVNQIITAGDTMTFSNGVDVVDGFDTEIDVLLGDIRISRSLLGQDAAALVTSGWLSGEYDELTGRFTIAENGEGTDVAIIQYTDTASSVNSNITTGIAGRNQNILILQDVDSDELQNSNFENAAGVGVNGINVIPLFAAGSLTLENGSWSSVLLNISAAGGFTPVDAVNPDTPTGFSQSGLTSVNLSNLGGSDTGADPSAGVTINLNGTTSSGLASVIGTSGDDEFVFATQELGASGVAINGLGGVNTLTFTAYTGASGVKLGDSGEGGNLVNIDEVQLIGGTDSSTGLILDDSLAGVEVTNLSTGTAAKVNLGTGAGNSYIGSAATGDNVTLGAASQTAEINSTSATITAISGNVITANSTGNTTLTLSGTGSLAANYEATSAATGDTLSFTGASGQSATGGTYTGFEVISLSNSTASGDVGFTLGSGTTDVTTLNLTYLTTGTVGVTLSAAQADALTAINLSGGTGTGGATITLGANSTVDFSNTTIADSSAGGSGVLTLALGTGVNEIQLSVLQFNNAAGEGFNSITAGTGAGDDNTLVLVGASGLTATGTTGNAPAGIDTIELGGTTAISINDSANAGVVREYIGNTAANTFTLGGQITAAKTVSLGVDFSQDSVVFDTGVGTSGSTGVTSILDFTAGASGDIANIGGSVTTVAGIVTDGAAVTATAAASGLTTAYVLAGADYEINGLLTETGDAGAVEQAIIAAQLLVTGAGSSGEWVSGDSFYAIVANNDDTGIYRVTLATNSATGGTTLDLPTEFSVSLVGVIDGIGNSAAQSYAAANFV